jgi:hypothetical protein
MSRLLGKITVTLAWLTAILLIPAPESSALDTAIQLTAGYDDNPSLSADATASSFACYQIKLAHAFFSDLPSVDGGLFVNSMYQDYFSIEDRYQFNAGGSLIFPLSEGRLLPGIHSDVLVYRDNFTQEDDRNDMAVGCQIDWLASGRLTLGIRQEWTWSDYRNPVYDVAARHRCGMTPDNDNTACSGPGQSQGYGQCQGQGQQGQDQTASQDREDRLSITGLHALVFLTPEIQTDLSLEYNRLSSSVDTESYRQTGAVLSLLWMPYELWEIRLETAYKRSEYDDAVSDRRDTAYHTNWGITRFINNFELFFQMEWTKNNSPLEAEDYRQTVTQCGVIWSF